MFVLPRESPFLALYVEGLTYEGSPSPGYVFDPRRHSRSDLPAAERSELTDFQQRVSVVSGAPRLTSAAYAALFTTMAADLARSPTTGQRLQSECAT
jgi:hypothetical protein